MADQATNSSPPVMLCPDCQSHLVERTNTKNGTTFMGCSRYPDCNHTEPVPTWLTMRRQGAAALPGFD